jgi:UDPglucose--hexose-1-phosphate uridylyltransferase
MERLAEILVEGGDPMTDALTEKHAAWVKTFCGKYTFTADNAAEILRNEIGRTFAEILEDAGVYARTEDGKAAFLRFLREVGAEEQ